MMCLETAMGESLGPDPRIQTPRQQRFLFATLTVEGDRGARAAPKQVAARTRSLVRVLETRIHSTEKDSPAISEPNRQGVKPAAIIYGLHSWLFWKIFPETSAEGRNLMSCSKAKGLFLLFTGGEARSLSLLFLFFFWECKAEGKRRPQKGGSPKRYIKIFKNQFQLPFLA